MRRNSFVAIVVMALGCLVASTGPAAAAGSVTVTSEPVIGSSLKSTTRYTIEWTSSAGGAVDSGATGNSIALARGRLVSIRLIPGTAGTQPSDEYDVTLVDSDGIDLLGGQGADVGNTCTSVDDKCLIQWDPPLLHDGSKRVTVTIAGAGSAKTGTVEILVESDR